MKEDQIELDPKRRLEAGIRAIELREAAGAKRQEAAILDAQASRIERAWQLRPYERP